MTEKEAAVVISGAQGEADMALVRQLFEEYADWLDIDLCFQGFAQELAGLPGAYAPPQGDLWLARVAGELAGVVGLRPLGPGICELKRLWVRPAFRDLGLGRRLTERAIAAAREKRYGVMRLDTVVRQMARAGALYAALGFRETTPYAGAPHPELRYLALDLAAVS